MMRDKLSCDCLEKDILGRELISVSIGYYYCGIYVHVLLLTHRENIVKYIFFILSRLKIYREKAHPRGCANLFYSSIRMIVTSATNRTTNPIPIGEKNSCAKAPKILSVTIIAISILFFPLFF